VLIGAYFDAQRPEVHQEPLSWTIGFWAHHGLGIAGILLARLAESSSTLGLFTLPLSVGLVAGWRHLRLASWQKGLLGASILAILAGFVVRTAVLGQSPLFPHAKNVLSPQGFQAFDYDGTLPSSIDIAPA